MNQQRWTRFKNGSSTIQNRQMSQVHQPIKATSITTTSIPTTATLTTIFRGNNGKRTWRDNTQLCY